MALGPTMDRGVSDRRRVVAMAHSRRQFLRVSVLGLGGVTIASLLAACGGAGPTAVPGKPTEAAKPAESKPAETKPAAPAAAAQPTTAPAAAKPAEAAKPADKPAAAAPAFAGGGSLKLLMRGHFVPAYDVWFDKWAADWGAKNKVQIEVDHIT